jgi:ribosomal protein S18 acetylase RimI-like enzyme
LEIALDSTPDVEVVRRLFAEYGASLGFSLDFQGFDEELAGLPGDYGPPRGALLVATVDGVPAGCAGLRPLDPATAEVKRLYVRPGTRGHGLGRRLTEALLDAARERGYDRVRLDTTPGMEAAQALYAVLRFREIAPYRPNPVPGARFLELDLR